MIASYSTFTEDVRRHGLTYALQHSADLGFDAVEILSTRRDRIPTASEVQAARMQFDAFGLPVACYSVGIDLSTGDTAPIETLKRHAEYAAILGSPYLHHTLLPALSQREDAPTYDQALPYVVEAAAQVAEHAASLGVICLYEPQGYYFNGTEGLGQFFARIKQICPNVGICADAGNPLFVHADPIALAKTFAPEVRHVHVKNYGISHTKPTAKERYLLANGTWLGETTLQAGAVDVAAFRAALPDYRGTISIEQNATDDELRAAIAFLKEITAV